MTLQVVIVVALALVVFGLGAAMLRRSLVGFIAGVELAAGGLVLLATALFDLSGMVTSTGQVIAVALIAFATAAATIGAALHLSGVRASRRSADLDPW